MIKVKINKIFLTLLLLSLILSIFFTGYFTHLIFYGLISILIIEWFNIIIQKHTLITEINSHDTILSAGNYGEYLTIIRNDIFIPIPYIIIESNIYIVSFSGYKGEVLCSTAEESPWIESKVKFYKRGIYDFGSINIKITDIFNIFTCIFKIDHNIKVKVYPRIYDIRDISSYGKDIYQEIFNLSSSNEDIHTIKEVRKYRAGDSIKKINWKVSAKHNELYVKESDRILGEEFTVFIDMDINNNKKDSFGIVEEQVIDLSISIINSLKNKGIKTLVYLNSKNTISFNIDSKDKFEAFVEYMITEDSSSKKPINEFVFENIYKIQKTNAIALITANFDNVLTEAIGKIKNSGYPVTLFYCNESEHNIDNVAYLNKIGVQCFSFNEVVIERK